MTPHLAWEELNDLVDGVLSPADESRARTHLDRCSECRARLDDLQATLREVATVAREIAPPEESWPLLRAEIDRRKLVTLETAGPEAAPTGARSELAPGSAAAPPSQRMPASPARTRTTMRWKLAAAAIVLVAASSAVTAVVMRHGAGTTPAVATSITPTPRDLPPATTLPAAMTEAERGYLASVEELSAALEMARSQLAPATIAIVERNLALIDSAIAESREALAHDPGNRVLMAVLDGTYRQKLELLRRAAQLGSS